MLPLLAGQQQLSNPPSPSPPLLTGRAEAAALVRPLHRRGQATARAPPPPPSPSLQGGQRRQHWFALSIDEARLQHELHDADVDLAAFTASPPPFARAPPLGRAHLPSLFPSSGGGPADATSSWGSGEGQRPPTEALFPTLSQLVVRASQLDVKPASTTVKGSAKRSPRAVPSTSLLQQSNSTALPPQSQQQQHQQQEPLSHSSSSATAAPPSASLVISAEPSSVSEALSPSSSLCSAAPQVVPLPPAHVPPPSTSSMGAPLLLLPPLVATSSSSDQQQAEEAGRQPPAPPPPPAWRSAIEGPARCERGNRCERGSIHPLL